MSKKIIAYILSRLNAKGILHRYEMDDLTGLDQIIYYKGIDIPVTQAGHRDALPVLVTASINSSTTLEDLAWLI